MITGTEFVLCLIFGALCGIGYMLYDNIVLLEKKEEKR